MLRTLAIANYRSLRDVVIEAGPLTVVTGPNGSGKSALYRALRLLADTARGGAVGALAREGGLASVLWAGPESVSRRMIAGEVPTQGAVRRGLVRLLLGFVWDDFGYAVDFGEPPQGPGTRSAFLRDPEIKSEWIWIGPVCRGRAVRVIRKRNLLVRRAPGVEEEVAAHGMSRAESILER